MNTGDWWKRQVESLPTNALLSAIEVYADATQLNDKASAHPIYLTSSNLPLAIKHNRKTKVLVGFVPKAFKTKRDFYHAAFTILLEPIKRYQLNGFKIWLGMELVHFVPRISCFPADMPE
ncbi:hypothetical protein BDR26DRAFT_787189, partial [Obelidium mucronatum]